MLLPLIKLFKKSKRSLELVTLLYFLHNFWRKIFLLLYSMKWPNSIVWLTLPCQILDNICIVIVFWLGFDHINFAVNFIFLTKPFFLHDQKVSTKYKYLENEKSFWRWNKKHFSTLLKAFIEANKTNFFGTWESDFNSFITVVLSI